MVVMKEGESQKVEEKLRMNFMIKKTYLFGILGVCFLFFGIAHLYLSSSIFNAAGIWGLFSFYFFIILGVCFILIAVLRKNEGVRKVGVGQKSPSNLFIILAISSLIIAFVPIFFPISEYHQALMALIFSVLGIIFSSIQIRKNINAFARKGIFPMIVLVFAILQSLVVSFGALLGYALSNMK